MEEIKNVKVARTYLFARSLCFSLAFFDRNDLTYFFDFFILNKEWWNLKKMLSFFWRCKTLEISTYV